MPTMDRNIDCNRGSNSGGSRDNVFYGNRCSFYSGSSSSSSSSSAVILWIRLSYRLYRLSGLSAVILWVRLNYRVREHMIIRL